MSDATTTSTIDAIDNVEVFDVPTSLGVGRLHCSTPRGRQLTTLVLGHGAGGGIDAKDLVSLASVLPQHGHCVVRVEQPWRVAGRKVAPRPDVLDVGWFELLGSSTFQDVRSDRLIVGGRSAGARVAARSAKAVDALALLALSFPLHPPGRPQSSRRFELPTEIATLIVQGSRDSFGRPDEFERLADLWELTVIPGADHGFAVSKAALITQQEVSQLIVERVLAWLRARLETTA